MPSKQFCFLFTYFFIYFGCSECIQFLILNYYYPIFALHNRVNEATIENLSLTVQYLWCYIGENMPHQWSLDTYILPFHRARADTHG